MRTSLSLGLRLWSLKTETGPDFQSLAVVRPSPLLLTRCRCCSPIASGKGGLASELPKAAWVSLETVKTSKTQRHPGTCKSKSTWNSIFKDSQSLQSSPKHSQRHLGVPKELPEHSKVTSKYSKTLTEHLFLLILYHSNNKTIIKLYSNTLLIKSKSI